MRAQRPDVGRREGGLENFVLANGFSGHGIMHGPVIHHRGDPVATHPVLIGHHRLAIVPEQHGPGAIARNARRIRATAAPCWSNSCPDVEIRDLTVYDALMEAGR